MLRRNPGERARIKEVVRGLGSNARRMEAVAQALIRAKFLDPRSFVTLRGRIEDARRMCRGCRRGFIGMPGEVPKVRRCVCGRVNRIPAITLRDEELPLHADEAPPKGSTGTARFVGTYRVLGRLGDGGMGSIFRVVNGEGERFALKRLHSEASGSARERFRREAEILSRLSHPNVVRVFELAVDEKGRPYFTMELVEGSTLQKLKGKLEPEVFVTIVARAAEGLHHAHEHGLVHRDVKPHNIVVGRKGEPKVVDFGLAHDVTANALTQEGDLLGTPLYMAPEQLRGEHDKVDRRADVYSLGALLYEGLCGRLPVLATSLVELREALERAEVPPPSDLNPAVSPALEAVILRALSKRPEDRQDTALTLSLDLRRALRRPNDAPTLPRAGAPGRLRWVALLVGLFGVLSLSLAGALFLRRRAAEQERRRAEGELTQTLESARATLEAAGLNGNHDEAVAAARAALASASQGLSDRQRAALDPARAEELAAESAALALRCHDALASLLADGPFPEREEARRLLAESLERDPERTALWQALARIDDLDGLIKRARAAAHEVVQREPRNGDAQYLLARSLFRLGEPGAAEVALQRALDGRPAVTSSADALATYGMLQLSADRLEDAQRLAREARQADPTSEELKLLDVNLALRGGDEPAACALFEELLASGPGPRAIESCVQYLVQAEDWRGAERLLDARIARDPSPLMLMQRGTVHLLQAQHSEADALFVRAMEAIPADEAILGEVTYLRARLLHAQARLDEAIDLLQGFLDGGQRSRVAPLEFELIQLLLTRERPQDIDRAEALLPNLAALELKQEQVLVEWQIALARSDLQGAERARRRAQEKLTEHPLVLMLEARHLAALGRTDQLAILQDRVSEVGPLLLRKRILPSMGLRPPFTAALERLQRGCALLRHARATGLEDTLRQAGKLFADAHALLPELSCAELLRISVEAEAGAAPEPLLDQLTSLERPGLLLVAAPEFPPARQHLEQLRGRQLVRSNRASEAVAAYSRALAVAEPSGSRGRRARRVQLLIERAEAYEAAGESSSALRDLDAALELAPLNESARVRRSQIRADSGDAAGAAEDSRQLGVLRAGPQTEVAAALAALERAKDPSEGEQALEQLRALQRVMDPRLHAELFAAASLGRARALFRWQGIGPAFDDLAALCQWNARGIETLYDLLAERLANQPQREQLLRVLRTPPELAQVDPKFRAGLGGFLLAEFCGVGTATAMNALQDYRLGGDDSASAPLLLAALEFALGYRARARGELARVFELSEVPAFAHYLVAREQVASGASDAAIDSLGAAWDDGFQPQSGYNEDPHLESLYGHPGFRRFAR
ncbi:MAG: protein kinase [Planctomycetes bacterium]|nr:protein kinase [Planctomycetota bacterium]